MAVASGYLYLEIRFNEEVGKMLDYTIERLTKEKIPFNHPLRSFKDKFKIDLSFSRDINIVLPLIPFGVDEDEHGSDSEWSLGDKPGHRV